MCAELNIPCWTAIQANRSGFGAQWLDATQMGGSIKRAQKSHFLMSVAKTAEQQLSGRANIEIIKSRFGASGLKFEEAIFDNNTMEIEIYNTSGNKIMKLNKPSIVNDKLIEQEVDREPKASSFDLTMLNQNREEIDEPTYSDDYEITLNKKAKEQEKILEKTE